MLSELHLDLKKEWEGELEAVYKKKKSFKGI